MNKKSLIFVFFIGFIISSCERGKEESELSIPLELFGKWKVVQVFGGTDVGVPNWQTKNSGCEWDYWFLNNSTYRSCNPLLINCQQENGKFIVESNKLIMYWEDLQCGADLQGQLSIEKISNDTLIYSWESFPAGKKMLIKIDSSISDICNCQ